MNGEKKSMWTTMETDILVHVVDSNFLGLRLSLCCYVCLVSRNLQLKQEKKRKQPT